MTDAPAGPPAGGRPTPEDGLPVLPDSSATVLVVDDDLAKRYLLHTWLRRAGHTLGASAGTVLYRRKSQGDCG